MKILDVKIDAITKTEAIAKAEQFLRIGEPCQIATVNPEFILKAQKDLEFRQILNNCDLNTADATGDLWASSFLSLPLTKVRFVRTIWAICQYIYTGLAIVICPKFNKRILPEKISGADFFWDLLKLANSRSESIFLLGGRNGVAEETAKVIKAKFSEIDIGYSEADPDDEKAIEEIKKVKPAILFVAYGAPRQEKWLAENLPKTGAKIGIGVGGTFDFISGKIKRAPKFIRSRGLEWLWRLIIQPVRVGRIYNAVVSFSFLILKSKIKGNFLLDN